MNEVVKDIERPYHVVAILGGEETFSTGHLTLEEANASADMRNEKAADLGITTRYEAREGAYLS